MYQSTTTSDVIRLSDGALIPADPSNRDYRDFLAWLSADPAHLLLPPAQPDHGALVARARADALPIRQLALDVLTGLQSDALVDGQPEVAALCRAARQRVKDMGALSLDACIDYESMRQAYKIEWASIVSTFDGYPAAKASFAKAIK